MIIFGTGHRPEDSEYDFYQMRDLAEEALTKTPEEVVAVLCGMAAGFDLAFGIAARELEIPLWTVRPWAGHMPRMLDREWYRTLELYATRHIIINDSLSYPGAWVYHKRNEWMVDNSDAGLAFWNGKESGGTYKCLEYAKSKNRPVLNIYPGMEQI